MWAVDLIGFSVPGLSREGTLGAVPIHDPAAPHAYSLWVLIMGVVLLLLIAAWLAWVFWFTRERPAPDPAAKSNYRDLRARTVELVDEAQDRYRSGESDLRALHLDLNHILREFASERLGIDTSSLTTAEISQLEGSDKVADLLGEYQEPAFAADSDARALSATARAREVINQW